jgi:hypothetical protein
MSVAVVEESMADSCATSVLDRRRDGPAARRFKDKTRRYPPV